MCGQDPKTEGSPTRDAPVAPLPPITPAEPGEPSGAQTRGQGSGSRSGSSRGRRAARPGARDRGPPASEVKDSPRAPAREARAPRPATARWRRQAGSGGRRQRSTRSRGRFRPRTGRGGDTAGPGAVPHSADPAPADGHPDGQGFVLPPDRLPLGKQEVMLSVEVQAPANLIYNRDTTVKIIVRNSGSTDAAGVVVRDELPAGLTCVSAQPEAQRMGDSLLIWRISTLPAGTERIILLKARPTKAGGALDHAATVTFQAGSKATSRVLRPRLKLEVVQTPVEGKVLKNKTAEFRIAVTNTGDGPARERDHPGQAQPWPARTRPESGTRRTVSSCRSRSSAPGQREDLDPLTVDALQGGEQWCRITANSTDVDFEKEAAQVERRFEVVEPKLKMTLAGPDKRFTDTVASYAITLENPGTAPAKNVKVMATLGVSGRLMAVPPGAKYDPASRRLQWTIPQIDPNEKGKSLPFEVRMGGISAYEINVEARGDNGAERQGSADHRRPGHGRRGPGGPRAAPRGRCGRHHDVPDPPAQLRHQGSHQAPGLGQTLRQPGGGFDRRRSRRRRVRQGWRGQVPDHRPARVPARR